MGSVVTTGKVVNRERFVDNKLNVYFDDGITFWLGWNNIK